jgi:hypothetical protein
MNIYIYRCKVGACKWVRVCVCANACDRVRSRAGAADALIRGMCSSALHRRTDQRCGPATHTRPRAASVRARVCVCDWAPTHPHRTMRARSVGVDRGWFGAQAFDCLSAFNADIGAWNTARVTTLNNVCAAFSAAAARHRRRHALGGSSMRRGPLCAAALPMRACVCAQTCGHSHARMSPCVGIAARSRDGIYDCKYIYVIYIYIYMYICMHYSYLYRYCVLV